MAYVAEAWARVHKDEQVHNSWCPHVAVVSRPRRKWKLCSCLRQRRENVLCVLEFLSARSCGDLWSWYLASQCATAETFFVFRGVSFNSDEPWCQISFVAGVEVEVYQGGAADNILLKRTGWTCRKQFSSALIACFNFSSNLIPVGQKATGYFISNSFYVQEKSAIHLL